MLFSVIFITSQINPVLLKYPSQKLFGVLSIVFEDLGFLKFQVLLSHLGYLSYLRYGHTRTHTHTRTCAHTHTHTHTRFSALYIRWKISTTTFYSPI